MSGVSLLDRLRPGNHRGACLWWAVVFPFVWVAPGVRAQSSPSSPPFQSSPGTLAAEPALPTEPAAPTTTQATNPLGIPLIPELLSPGLEPPRHPRAPSVVPPVGSPAPGTIPVDPPAVPAVPETTTNNLGTTRRFQYGFSLTLGSTYDDNILLESSRTRSDVFFTIQPTVTLGFGKVERGGSAVRFSYSPQVLLYTDHSDFDTVQHFVSLSGSCQFGHLTLRASQEVQVLDSTEIGNPHPSNQFTTPGTNGPVDGGTVINTPTSNVNLDAGQRTRVNIYTTLLYGVYPLSDKLSFDLNGSVNISDYAGGLLSNRTLSTSGFAEYAVTGKTVLGLGLTGGYVSSDPPNPDQGFEQINLRVSYVASSKLACHGQAGYEFRQSIGTGKNAACPIFELNVVYNPFDGTSVTLAANREVQTSVALGGQDYRITGFALGLSQRFFQKVYARLSVGYSHSDYVASTTDVTTNRIDDYFFVQPSLDYNVRENVTVGGFYSHRESTSSQGNRDFSQNQLGVRVSFSF